MSQIKPITLEKAIIKPTKNVLLTTESINVDESEEMVLSAIDQQKIMIK
jgi:hypothetical protein